jgi:hypothetical protein
MTHANDNIDVSKMGQAIKVTWMVKVANVARVMSQQTWHVITGGKARS